jgi:hypothetical protein
MAMVGLQWLYDPSGFGTNLWTGPFGVTPRFQGIIDAGLPQQSLRSPRRDPAVLTELGVQSTL